MYGVFKWAHFQYTSAQLEVKTEIVKWLIATWSTHHRKMKINLKLEDLCQKSLLQI